MKASEAYMLQTYVSTYVQSLFVPAMKGPLSGLIVSNYIFIMVIVDFCRKQKFFFFAQTFIYCYKFIIITLGCICIDMMPKRFAVGNTIEKSKKAGMSCELYVLVGEH
jgi:hypothetical protein